MGHPRKNQSTGESNNCRTAKGGWRWVILVMAGVALSSVIVVKNVWAEHDDRMGESYVLQDQLREGAGYRVEITVRLRGRLQLPPEVGEERREIPLHGEGRLVYVERLLTPGVKDGEYRSVRWYEQVELRRQAGENVQVATLRPEVRRLVLLAQQGKRAPFSPDGPLTWAELDLIRTDPFIPYLVSGLLPGQPVKVQQTWKATLSAVRELTDLDEVDEGEIRLRLVGPVELQGRRLLRLQLSGQVRGRNADGQHVHQLEGTVYHDPAWPGLTYMSVRGSHQLLDEKGQPAGRIEGAFTLSRGPVRDWPPPLQESALARLKLWPDADNTLLLFSDELLGLRFLYPRGWRVSMVRGGQVTLDHVRGAGLLLTVEPAGKMPTPQGYLQEVEAFLRQQQARWHTRQGPRQVQTEPTEVVRFGLTATVGNRQEQLEYAIIQQKGGGVTVAARLPLDQAEALLPEVERIIRSIRLTPPRPKR
ncbi:MAG: hypothetical protein RMJ88_14735 [Thermogemmata sp.]|nr:hypothetical protein [Thermogemmata sp.]